MPTPTPTPETLAARRGHLTARTDGRWDVADTGEANDTWGCTGDTECILSKGHPGVHDECRETDVVGGESPSIPLHAVDPFTPVLVPAGTYLVGDITLALPPQDWDLWVAEASHGLDADSVLTYVADLPTPRGSGFTAAFRVPNGTYRDQDGRTYPVASGLLGLIAVDVAPYAAPVLRQAEVTFEEPVRMRRTEDDGPFLFGRVQVTPTDRSQW